MRLVQNHNKAHWRALRPRQAYTFQRRKRLSRCRLAVRCSPVWRGQCVKFRAICWQSEGQKIGTFPAEITGKSPFVQAGSDFALAIPQIYRKSAKPDFLGFSFLRSPLFFLPSLPPLHRLSRSAFGGAPSVFRRRSWLPVLVLTLYQILRDRASRQQNTPNTVKGAGV